MLGLLKYPDDFANSQGLNQLCTRIEQPLRKGTTWVGKKEDSTSSLNPIQEAPLVLESLRNIYSVFVKTTIKFCTE